MKLRTMQDWLSLIDQAAADWKAENGEDMPDDQRQMMLQVARESMELQAAELQDSPPPTRAGFTTSSAMMEQTKAAQTAKVIQFPQKPKLTVEEQLAEMNAPCANCNGECLKIGGDRYFTITGIDEDGHATAKRCPVGVQRIMAEKFRSAKIPNRYLNKTFDDYRVDEFNRDAVTFAKNFERFNFGAYFFGSCGTGKTFLSSLIAQEFLRDGKSVLFAKVPYLLDDIRQTFNSKLSEVDLLEQIETVDLLVLDDFGMEKSTQWAGSTLCKIIDSRYDNASDGRNLNGSRIADLLNEICKPILLKGTTRRN